MKNTLYRLLQNFNFKIIIFILLIVLGIEGLLNKPPNPGTEAKAILSTVEKEKLGSFPITIPVIKYGMAMDTFQISENSIQNNQTFSVLLSSHNIDYLTIDKIINSAKEVFDVNMIRAGKPYTILADKQNATPEYLIYEPSVYEYFVFKLFDDFEVKKVEKTIKKSLRTAEGEIETSLWNTITGQGLSYQLASKMEDALQWSIDFFHVQKGDKFNLLFEEEAIDGKTVGIGRVLAAYYKNYDNEYYAIYFDNGIESGYYDEEGRPMDKSFLRSPVKYARISSRYNPNRFHPILKYRRAHLGTDYAAPRGTPIQAVGDGVVVKASYGRGNGNFVKIRHSKTYQTQYLHMSKFAKGIAPGVHVKQGQTIGYVGSTGLATGPHVCFRFWKNGKQVDHLKLSFPPPKPLSDEYIDDFKHVRDVFLGMLSEKR